MVKLGIIEQVTHPTAWVHPMVVVPKPSGKVRVMVDLTKLNKHTRRPYFPLHTPSDVLTEIQPGQKYFSLLDALKGYHQLPLAEESRDLTCFTTPWGRYRFVRGVMGCNITSDEYERRMREILGDVPNVHTVVDDTLCATMTAPKHLERIVDILERCRQNRVTLSRDKFVFCQPSVAFVGYILDSAGIHADPNKVKAISEFPIPTNITDLRSFFGLIAQLADYSTEVSAAAEPLRPLLQPQNVFKWEDVHT